MLTDLNGSIALTLIFISSCRQYGKNWHFYPLNTTSTKKKWKPPKCSCPISFEVISWREERKIKLEMPQKVVMWNSNLLMLHTKVTGCASIFRCFNEGFRLLDRGEVTISTRKKTPIYI